jgi:CubicO group peptidase (beta-lactamase class C family)
LFVNSKCEFAPIDYSVPLFTLAFVLMIIGFPVRAQEPKTASKLQGFDSHMEQGLKDWNTSGIGGGIIINIRLTRAMGYGYRNYEKKLPFTPTTLFQIASDSKLFTAVAASTLAEEGKLTWDKPVREFVPAFQLYNDQLYSNVILRDQGAVRAVYGTVLPWN